MLFHIVFSVLFLLSIGFLELNKNSLVGWALVIALFVGFYLLRSHYKQVARMPMRLVSWACLALLLGVVVRLTWPSERPVKAVKATNPPLTEVVHAPCGDVQGVVDVANGIEVFAGIPYAKPPISELRWRKPQEADRWEGVLACDEFAPMSMQQRNMPFMDSLTQIIGYHDYEISLFDNHIEPVSEDSLYLNIWRPKDGGEDLPVIVFIHGGSLQTGQPWYGDYAGTGMAKKGAVFVNMGYRLGVFGFLTDEDMLASEQTSGNYGLLDQIKALEWVRDNIEAFGGDPGNVTLAGESAGAVCVSALCTSAKAKGLFRRAVLESSTLASKEPPHSFRLLDEAISSGRDLMQRHGCANVDELRQCSSEELVGEMQTQHHVTIDGYVLERTPYESYMLGEFNEEKILHGFNSHESGPFIIFSQANMKNYEEKVKEHFGDYAARVLALYPASSDEEASVAWANIYGALFFNYQHHCLERMAQRNNIPSALYYFAKENGRLGSWHSGEMAYMYGNIPEDSRLYDESDRILSTTMQDYLYAFAKDGTLSFESMTRLSTKVETITDPNLALYEILDEMTGWGQ